jgi:hypothetical protein
MPLGVLKHLGHQRRHPPRVLARHVRAPRLPAVGHRHAGQVRRVRKVQHVPGEDVAVLLEDGVAAVAAVAAVVAPQRRVGLQRDERQVGAAREDGFGAVGLRRDGDEARGGVDIGDVAFLAHLGPVPDVVGGGGDGAVAVAEDGAGVFAAVGGGGGGREVVEPQVGDGGGFKVDVEFVDDEEERYVGWVGGVGGPAGAGWGGFGGFLVFVGFVVRVGLDVSVLVLIVIRHHDKERGLEGCVLHRSPNPSWRFQG